MSAGGTEIEAASEARAARREKAPLQAWWMLAVLLALYILSFIDRYILTMLVVPIQRDIGLSDFEMSLILGPAFAVFYSIFGIPLAWAADRYPRRWVIFLGVVTWSVAATCSGLARSFVSLFVARVFVGVGEASLTPAAYSMLADAVPRHRLTLAMSIYQTGVKIGSATAFAVGALAIAFAEGFADVSWPLVGALQPWQIVLIMTGAPGIALAFLVFTFSEPPRSQPKKAAADRDRLLAFLRKEAKLILPMLVCTAMITISGYSLTFWVPTYIERAFQWGPVRFGPILAAISLVAAGAMVVKGLIVDWLYGRGIEDAHLRFYSWLLAGTTPVVFVMFHVDSAWLFLVLFGVVQVVAIQASVYMTATVQIVAPPDVRAQTTAIFLGVGTILGLGVGPTLVGAATDYVFADQRMVGYSLALVVSIAFPLALAAVRIALPHARRAVAAAT